MSDSQFDGAGQERKASSQLRGRSNSDGTHLKARHKNSRSGSTLDALNLVYVKGMGGFEAHYETAEFHHLNPKNFMVEQLVNTPGTLHAPLDEFERSKRRDSTQLTTVPRELARVPGEEGQLLRRGLLSGATIVFFTPGYEGKRFIYEHAKSLNVSSVIIDGPGSWAQKLEDELVIKKYIALDMEQDSENVYEDALAVIRQLDQDPKVGAKPDGICTFSELSLPIVARLCETLGLPGSPASAIDVARNKHSTRAAMSAAGLATPANALVKGDNDLAAAIQTVGFPAVLKPISGAASLGVKKVTDEKDLYSAFAEVKREMLETVVTSGALIKSKTVDSDIGANLTDSDLAPPKPSQQMECVFMLEEYLDGPEVDVDVVMSDGEAQYVVVVDNGPTVEPYFNETWGLCPSQLSAEKQQELRDMGVASLKCCGFTVGVFHVELKYTSRGPRLIEINARMGGGQVRETHRRVHGVDLVEETLFGAVGIPNRPHKIEPPLCNLAYNYVNARKSGRVSSLRAIDRYNEMPDVVYAKPLVNEGDEIVGPEEGMPTWVADIMVSKATADEALEYVLSLSDSLDIPLMQA